MHRTTNFKRTQKVVYSNLKYFIQNKFIFIWISQFHSTNIDFCGVNHLALFMQQNLIWNIKLDEKKNVEKRRLELLKSHHEYRMKWEEPTQRVWSELVICLKNDNCRSSWKWWERISENNTNTHTHRQFSRYTAFFCFRLCIRPMIQCFHLND